jgi:hypothetical protein
LTKTTVPTRLYLTPRQKAVLEATARRDGLTVSGVLPAVVESWISESVQEGNDNDG